MGAKTFKNILVDDVLKFNPYHDALGRFSGAGGAATFTYKPGQGVMYDNAIARERERSKASNGGSIDTITAKENLVSGLGGTHAENIEKVIQKAPDFVKNIWEKYAGTIQIQDSKYRGIQKCDAEGRVYVNIEKNSQNTNYNNSYETTMHEFAHAMDKAISAEKGYRYSRDYKNGLLEQTMKKEAETYIKERQKKMEAESGGKVKINNVRSQIGKELIDKGSKSAGDVSDMFEGATKGKVSGAAGHGKAYWNDKKYRVTYDQTIVVPGRSVALEGFAEMFSATTTNPESLAQIKEYFPESYGVFKDMLGEL